MGSASVRPRAYGLSILRGSGFLGELKDVADLAEEHRADLRRTGEEELLAVVRAIWSAARKVTVKLSFQADGVFGEEQGMGVEAKRDGRATELIDAIAGFEPSRESDLHHVLAECALVRNDIDVACTDVGGSVVVLLDGGVDLCGSLRESRIILPVLLQGSQRVEEVKTCCVEACAFFREHGNDQACELHDSADPVERRHRSRPTPSLGPLHPTIGAWACC